MVHGDSRRSSSHAQLIKDHEDDEIGICTMTLWEVAKLVELGRLVLPVGLDQWFADACAYPGVTLVNLTPGIALESTQLPGTFHRDPADQIIVATSRILECNLLTADQRIGDYSHVAMATRHGRKARSAADAALRVTFAGGANGGDIGKTLRLFKLVFFGTGGDGRAYPLAGPK